ncbi:MAG: hypothetical protein Q9222_002791 [Ikaeria aurantiellina]
MVQRNEGQTNLQLPDGASNPNPYLSLNAITLDPKSAGLPYRSSVTFVRASRFWRANVGEASTLLRLIAGDDSASDIEVNHGITLAKLAKKVLGPGFEHGMVLAAHYMFPAADEERIKLISALMILYFVFDDKAEETSNTTLHTFREDFLNRLGGNTLRSSPFQSHMNQIVQSIEDADVGAQSGGKEMLEALHEAFRCVHPPSGGFRNVKEYFQFRRFNVGAAFVIAAAKFSTRSEASLADPRFQRYFSLVADHLGLVNDLASYDKEIRALEAGETSDMINIVDVVKGTTLLQDTDEAKQIVWMLQLQIEKQIVDELAHLQGQLSSDEWWFLEAVLCTLTGNVMFCMTTNRYGGEAARIERGKHT